MSNSLKIGLRLKRKMEITTLACVLPAIFFCGGYSAAAWFLALLASFLHANILEFFLHRWSHNPSSPRFQAHMRHHITQHTEVEAEHAVLFAGSPWSIAALIYANLVPWLFTPWAPIVLLGFGAYLLLTEECHWRAHLGGWLPEAWRKYHMGHHEFPPKNFNVFLGLGDWLFGA